MNKKGILMENLLIGVLAFSLVIAVGVTLYASNAANYEDTIENTNISKFSGIQSGLDNTMDTVEGQKQDLIDSEIDEDASIADTPTAGIKAAKLVWNVPSTTKNITSNIVRELAFGGDEERSSQVMGVISTVFTGMIIILFIFAILYIFIRFKPFN